MSIIFGIQTWDRQPVEEARLRLLAEATNAFALDGTFLACEEEIAMGFQPFHTHARSPLEVQPAVDERRNILVLDGRLDNYRDLQSELELHGNPVSDSRIILAAFARWGDECFKRLVGEWALALWSRADRSLYLVRDPAGTRTLFYELGPNTVVWSTYLETFFAEPRSRGLCREFAMRFLAFEPLGVFTPYKGILAVPASHYVRIRQGESLLRPHWSPPIEETLHYPDDQDYDAHFREVLTTAVRRRTSMGDPVVAELSGGMDSTSIVCIADQTRARVALGPEDLIDTISYYDDAESSWDEYPYFSLTERRRGKEGIHFRVRSADRTFETNLTAHFWPGGDQSTDAREAALSQILTGRGHRAIVSGHGGDELLGGFPDSRPELADALFEGDLQELFWRALEWSLVQRDPLAVTLWGALAYAAGPYLRQNAGGRPRPPWVRDASEFAVEAAWTPCLGELLRRKIRPSSIGNSLAWWHLLESLPSRRPSATIRREYRYPYLDRDFAEFIFRVPRNQIQRAGRRRNLHRRALAGIVPAPILERRRKAFKQHGSLLSLQNAKGRILELFRHSLLEQSALIQPDEFMSAFEEIVSGRSPQWRHALLRAIDFELWLRSTDAIA